MLKILLIACKLLPTQHCQHNTTSIALQAQHYKHSIISLLLSTQHRNSTILTMFSWLCISFVFSVNLVISGLSSVTIIWLSTLLPPPCGSPKLLAYPVFTSLPNFLGPDRERKLSDSQQNINDEEMLTYHQLVENTHQQLMDQHRIPRMHVEIPAILQHSIVITACVKNA